MKKIKFRKPSLFEVLMAIYFLIQTVFSIYLLVWAFTTSLKDEMDYILNPISLPKKIIWQYGEVIRTFKVTEAGVGSWYFDQLFLHSVLTSTVFVGVHLITVMAASYVCALYPFKLSEIVVTVVMVVINIPIVGSTGSGLLFAKFFGLYDSLWGNAVLKIGILDISFLIFYSAFKTLSREYAEAAFIDGAGHFRTMVTIMFPLLSNLATVQFVTGFIGQWASYTDILMYLPSMPTIAYGLHMFRTNSKTSSSTTFLFAACLLSCVPSFALFFAFRKKMMGDLGVGGLKG